MRMQDSQANCGAYAVKNALAALGIERTASELEAACKTSATHGTSSRNIVKALSKIEGCDPLLIKEKRLVVARLLLNDALRRGRPVVIAWNSEEPGDHWVAVVGLLGDRYLVADSADNELVVSGDDLWLADHWGANGYEGVIL